VSLGALSLPLAGAPPPPAGRFAAPPGDRNHPDGQRRDRQRPPDPLARPIDRAVGLLDLSALFARSKGRGALPSRPDLLWEAPSCSRTAAAAAPRPGGARTC
jgi:hypothetical protein